jgi:hypothetical protein
LVSAGAGQRRSGADLDFGLGSGLGGEGWRGGQGDYNGQDGGANEHDDSLDGMPDCNAAPPDNKSAIVRTI